MGTVPIGACEGSHLLHPVTAATLMGARTPPVLVHVGLLAVASEGTWLPCIYSVPLADNLRDRRSRCYRKLGRFA
jgi:hypothetical protein